MWRELQETKEELFVREEKLKSVAKPLAQIAAFTGASEGRMPSKEIWSIKRKWYKKKLEELISSLDLTPSEAQEAKKFLDKYEAIDKLLADQNALKTADPDYEREKAEIESQIAILRQELNEMMKQDLQK